MNKVLIVGHSPAKKNVLKSPTMKKLHRWLDECCIDTYAFTNLCPEPKQKLTQLDTHVPDTLGHDKIIALGGEVSKFLKKIGVAHFAAPIHMKFGEFILAIKKDLYLLILLVH